MTFTAPTNSTAAALARPELPLELFGRFADLIYTLSGIRFQESKSYFLASKLQSRCTALGLATFADYLMYLNSPHGRTEYGHMIDAITINETFFYRHQPQLDAFEKQVLLPMIQDRKARSQTKIRIWSCAASTGDELYTIALMIKARGLDNQMQFDLIGTDICHDALEKARAGVYRQYAIRNVPQDQLKRYFTEDTTARTFTLNPDIKQMVTFKESNLVDSMLTQTLGKFDLAFCRNVLIYFDEPAKEMALQNIYNAMHLDGVLLMGHSEDIYRQRHLFKADRDRQAAIAYLKAPPGTPKP